MIEKHSNALELFAGTSEVYYVAGLHVKKIMQDTSHRHECLTTVKCWRCSAFLSSVCKTVLFEEE